MKIIIKGELTDLNTYINSERANRFIGAKIKQDNTNLCLWQLKGKFDKLEGKYHITFTWYCKDKKKDPDNICSYGRKVILDSLVKAGILPNDGWANISGFSDYFEVDKDVRVEIEFTEVER